MLARPLLRRWLALPAARYHTRNNGEILRRVFDDAKFFSHDFQNGASGPGGNPADLAFGGLWDTTKRSGLFRNTHLHSPQGLVEFLAQSLDAGHALVAQLVSPHQSAHDRRLFVKRIDRLSDILCKVIDVAEFIRVAHPSAKWVQAAQTTHEMMFEFMNQLNTNVELYQNLILVLDDPQVAGQLSSEELKVGDYLAKDFERSGIDFDDATRQNFVSITQEISLLGLSFTNGTQQLGQYWCEVLDEEYALLDPAMQSSIKRHFLKSGSVNKLTGAKCIPLVGEIPYTILTLCPNELLRKKLWIALHSSTPEQLELLNAIIKYRLYLAAMLGFKSFSAYQLEHKMAKSPQNVMSFLGNLQRTLILGGVKRELEALYGEHTKSIDIVSAIKPWDRDYLLARLQLKHALPTTPQSISEYLSVGTVMAGLNKLFQLIYNISLLAEPTIEGETWNHNQVRKLSVYDNATKQPLGYLYVDFWSLKVLPSHFTIVCLRELDPHEEDVEEAARQVHVALGHQLPVITLVCNFAQHHAFGSAHKPTLLSLDQVDTIFHEMGHAMHSMIGRTRLHNLAGTRCLTDFVELPSVLMEFFSRDPRVLSKIGLHYETDEPLAVATIEAYQKSRVGLEDCETYIQLKMAMLDQVLHLEAMVQYAVNGEEIDSTQIYHELEGQLKVFADKWSTWHGKFPHLFLYGAVYYLYLLDRAIAEKVWRGLFEADPWSRAGGAKYKECILKWGGTKDPWDCLADALGDEELRRGDERAMEIIGRAPSKGQA